MSQLLMFLPLIFAIVLVACFLKFTAFIFRRTRLSWKHSFMFTGIVSILAFANAFRLKMYGELLNPAIETFLLVAIMTVIGGAFFRGRAYRLDGVPFSYMRGAALTGLNFGLGIALSLSIFLLISAFAPVSAAAPSHQPSDLSVEVVGFSPAYGSTLLAQEPIDVLLKYRYC